MSHNTVIKDVKITDLDALTTAVDQLIREGVNIAFDREATKFRTYRGQPDACQGAIRLPGEAFDIGLKREEDGTYVPVFDHMLDQNRSIACAFTPGERRSDRHTIGKLMQYYTAAKAEKEAALQGHMISSRTTDPQTGEILITVEV